MRGPGVEGVGGAPGEVLGQAPGAQHAVGGLVGDHHGGHARAAGPAAGPAQGGPVGDLQAVGGQLLQEGGHAPLVGEDAVAAGAGQQRTGQGDDPALLGVAVGVPFAGHDQDRFVARGPKSPAEFPQGGAQAPGGGGDEVGEADDAQGLPGHAATAVFRSARTSS